jgi:hypothetical protein
MEQLGQLEIPYDSHCIDPLLRSPFALNAERYPPGSETLSEILNYLNSTERHLLLTQTIGIPFSSFENFSADGGVAIMDETGSVPLLNLENGVEVFFPDYLHPNTGVWLQQEIQRLDEIPYSVSGLVLLNTFPRTENRSASECSTRQNPTRLEKIFYAEDGDSSGGEVCPTAIHLPSSEDGMMTYHFDVHNVYGHSALQEFQKYWDGDGFAQERSVLGSESVWIGSRGFTGLAVPFTWGGLLESLSHAIRHSMILPFPATPICGSYLPREEDQVDEVEVDDLCLRWFQVGLRLPFARNQNG